MGWPYTPLPPNRPYPPMGFQPRQRSGLAQPGPSMDVFPYNKDVYNKDGFRPAVQVVPELTAPPESTVSIPPQNDDLQKKFPGHYASLATGNLMKDSWHNLQQTAETVQKVGTLTPVKDHQLVILDDNVKRMGSLAIATLATVGLKQKVLGVGEYMGFMSWLGAMAATPKLINAMVKMKTGVNLDQVYDSTYGQRQNLFKDPNYLPLHILPDETINRVADRYNIPLGPNRRQQTEEKMRQISVQARTWMMLVAGPATPVISGLICDNLQDWGVRTLNQIQMKTTAASARSAKNGKNQAEIAKRTRNHLNRLVGERPEALLSSWWKDFDRGILHKTGLGQHLSIHDVVDSKDASLFDNILKYLGDTSSLKLTHVENTLKYLDRQYKPGQKDVPATGRLEDLKKKADDFLAEFKEQLSASEFEAQKLRVEDRIHNAQSTVTHYRNLFETIRASFADEHGKLHDERVYNVTKRVRDWMRDTNAQVVSDLILQGRLGEAEKMAGRDNPHIFKKILQASGTERAGDLMGATPESHLIKALRDMKLGSLWRRRMVGYLGGGLLAATVLYTTFFVGRDFRKNPSPSGAHS